MYNSTNLAFKLRPVNLRLFDGNPNTNVTTDLTVEMKTYYDDRLIDLAQPLLVHDQFGQKRPIPKNGGKTIEFRKYAPLTKATTALTEGVTPDGKKLSVSKIEATVKQYGDYVTLSDVLLLTAIDNNLTQAQNLLGNQAGMTLDTITRDILVTGTNVQYAEGQVSSRADLVGGDETAENNHYMTVKCIKLAVRSLKTPSGSSPTSMWTPRTSTPARSARLLASGLLRPRRPRRSPMPERTRLPAAPTGMFTALWFWATTPMALPR